MRLAPRVHGVVGLMRPACGLTAREYQVIAALMEGGTNQDIARDLGLTVNTVKNHLTSIFDKLGVSTRLELALYASHYRLLEVRTPSARATRHLEQEQTL